MKRPDLLILIVIWEFVAAFLAFIGVCAIAVFAFPAVGLMWHRAPVAGFFGLSVAVLILLVYIGIAVAGGIGLLQGKEWGRLVSIAQAAVSMLSIPFGTVIGILVLLYLTKPEVREYFVASGS